MSPILARSVRGMAATEFILAAVPLLLAGLGAFEAAHWNLARQAVSFALLEGARAGAASHANPAAIENAFMTGLQPLGHAHARPHLPDGQAPWKIEILSPRPAHFADFPGPNSNGVRTINHAYQSLQHQRALNAGLPGGRGHTSGDTVFGANTLSLRLTYLHVPLVPGLRTMLRHLGSTLPDTGFAAQAMRDAGVLPIRQTVSLAMQSSPWEQEHDSIRAPAARLPARSPAAASATQAYAPSCRGFWCDTAWPGQPGERGQSVIAAPRPATPPAPSEPAAFPWDDTEQACQAALCCADPAM